MAKEITGDVFAVVSNGRPARGSGLVITRHRPGTAAGTAFRTLKDETGTVDVVV